MPPPRPNQESQDVPPSLLGEGPAPPPGLPNPADPRLLLVANSDGSLKPEFQEWDLALELEAESLLPVWWPWEVEGEPLSPQEREQNFRMSLDMFLTPPALPRPSSSVTSLASATASPTRPSLTGRAVLQSLLRLRSVVRPD